MKHGQINSIASIVGQILRISGCEIGFNERRNNGHVLDRCVDNFEIV